MILSKFKENESMKHSLHCMKWLYTGRVSFTSSVVFTFLVEDGLLCHTVDLISHPSHM